MNDWQQQYDNPQEARMSGVGFIVDSKELEEVNDNTCVINARLLDSAQGVALYAKFMSATIQIQGDGEGRARSQTGWQCALCGAQGTGKLPAFHAKGKDIATPIEALAWKAIDWNE